MKLAMTVYSPSASREKLWVEQVHSALQQWIDVDVKEGSKTESLGQIVFVDATDSVSGHHYAGRLLDEVFSRFERRGRIVFLVVHEETKDFPALLLERRVDDVLLMPFRPLELLSKIQNYEQLLLWNELSQLNASFSEILGHLHFDLELAERLQKSQLPKRFTGIKGLEVFHRYLVGSRSGGDYFDLAESKDQSTLSLVLSNSSSYGLCNSILSVLMRVCLKISADQLQKTDATTDVVRSIYQEILLTLRAKDYFSIFFGTLDRQSLLLRFTFLGEGALYYSPPGQPFQYYPPMEQVISRESAFPEAGEFHIQLHPRGRLILLSGGVMDLLGGASEIAKAIASCDGKPLQDLLNEISYRIKSSLEEGDLPARDCTAITFEVKACGAPSLVTVPKPGQVES